jgi:putative ABC transport system substrate-binding protein
VNSRGRIRLVPAFALMLALAGWIAPGRSAAGTVVLLRSRPLAPYDSTAAGFRGAYRGILVEITLGEGADPALEGELRRLRPEVVVAIGLRAALFARDRLPRTPMVFCVVPDPRGHDLEGAWITGVSADVPPDLDLAALRRAAPDVRRVGLVIGAGADGDFRRRARAAAAHAGLSLVEASVTDAASLAARAREIVDQVDALWMPADAAAATPEGFRFLLELSLAHRKPLLAFTESLVRAGAFVAMCPDYAWVGARAAEAVRRIQAGERAGDIPVARLERTRLVVNASTARALGREIPAGIIAVAEGTP